MSLQNRYMQLFFFFFPPCPLRLRSTIKSTHIVFIEIPFLSISGNVLLLSLTSTLYCWEGNRIGKESSLTNHTLVKWLFRGDTYSMFKCSVFLFVVMCKYELLGKKISQQIEIIYLLRHCNFKRERRKKKSLCYNILLLLHVLFTMPSEKVGLRQMMCPWNCVSTYFWIIRVFLIIQWLVSFIFLICLFSLF